MTSSLSSAPIAAISGIHIPEEIKHLNADPAKFYKNMDRHGNTSAASIPVALNELAEAGKLTPGQRVACIGFGGGLTWGGMILTYKG